MSSASPSTPPRTFADLVALEPRLARLDARAKAVAKRERRKWKRCCGNRPFYAEVKPRLVDLVGNQRRPFDPLLSTSAAYDVVYDHLYTQMPDCRECPCM